MHVHRRVEEQPEIQVARGARAASIGSHISSVGKSVVEEAIMAARAH